MGSSAGLLSGGLSHFFGRVCGESCPLMICLLWTHSFHRFGEWAQYRWLGRRVSTSLFFLVVFLTPTVSISFWAGEAAFDPSTRCGMP